MSPQSERISPHVLTTIAVGVLATIVYLVTAAPTFYWLDSSEFVAASWDLGVAHPPGHPLAVLLGRLFCFLPFGTIAFRVNLASAVQAGVAVSLIAAITGQVLRRAKTESRWCSSVAMIFAALSAAFSFALWFQAVRAEVYMLNLALLLGAVQCLLVWEDKNDARYALCAAFLLGLGLCNHHLLIIVALPAIAFFVLLVAARADWLRWIGQGTVAIALGLGTLLMIPLRAATNPEVNWGSATTLERFYWLISAQAFQKSVHRATTQSIEDRVVGAFAAMMTNLTPWVVLMSLGGIYLLLRQPRTRKAALFVGTLVIGNLLTPFLVGFDPFNADAHGYLAVSVAIFAVGAAVFIAIIMSALQSTRWRAVNYGVVVLLLLSPAWQLVGHAKTCDLRTHWAAEETSRSMFELPPGAIVISGYYETTFNAWALHAIHDHRPDVTFFDWHFLSHPAYGEQVVRRYPELKTVIRLHDGIASLSWSHLQELARERTISLEYDDDIPSAVATSLQPFGLLLSPSASGSSSLSEHQAVVENWMTTIAPNDDLETRRARTFYHYRMSQFACRRDPQLFNFHLQHALALAPEDRKIKELAATCQ